MDSTLKICCFALALAVQSGNVQAQLVAPAPNANETLPLWSDEILEAKGSADTDIPVLTVYRPEHSSGAAMIIAPGGAYRGLSMVHEGQEPGERMAAMGITAFVLRYRYAPKYTLDVSVADAQRAIRLVRSLAPTYGYDPTRIGMMGFSAGGHLAAMAATAPRLGKADAADPVEQLSSELNFAVLVYPWLNAMQPVMIGRDGKEKLAYCTAKPLVDPAFCTEHMREYTPALLASTRTPPIFIVHTTPDQTVPVATSIAFYSTLEALGDDVELHIFAKGKHGIGLGGERSIAVTMAATASGMDDRKRLPEASGEAEDRATSLADKVSPS